MKLPRDLSGADLIRRLERFGYVITREAGSHVRLTTMTPQQHHVTVPRHDALRVGTLAAILSDVAATQRLSRDELLQKLFS